MLHMKYYTLHTSSSMLHSTAYMLHTTIANYCSLPLLSFGQIIGKLQGKVVTQFEELGWWSFPMVDCVTLF